MAIYASNSSGNGDGCQARAITEGISLDGGDAVGDGDGG